MLGDNRKANIPQMFNALYSEVKAEVSLEARVLLSGWGTGALHFLILVHGLEIGDIPI